MRGAAFRQDEQTVGNKRYSTAIVEPAESVEPMDEMIPVRKIEGGTRLVKWTAMVLPTPMLSQTVLPSINPTRSSTASGVPIRADSIPNTVVFVPKRVVAPIEQSKEAGVLIPPRPGLVLTAPILQEVPMVVSSGKKHEADGFVEVTDYPQSLQTFSAREAQVIFVPPRLLSEK